MKETVERNNRFYTKENGEILTENEQLKEWLVIANKHNEELQQKIDKAMKYIEELLREVIEITDEDNADYGMKCQRAYFSDSELIKVLELLGDKK